MFWNANGSNRICMKHTIDATDKILGRIATEIAVILRGKNSAKFLPYVDSGNSVDVVNIDKVKISGNKASTKPYWRYTGYPGGIRKIIYEDLEKKNPGETLRRAVYGMLPVNKTRVKLMKRLVVK